MYHISIDCTCNQIFNTSKLYIILSYSEQHGFLHVLKTPFLSIQSSKNFSILVFVSSKFSPIFVIELILLRYILLPLDILAQDLT